MATLSVRIPKDLEEQLPKKNRSAWVIEALRAKARRERLERIADSAAADAEHNLEVLAEWEPVTAPLPDDDYAKG